jgi:hypothetical protein
MQYEVFSFICDNNRKKDLEQYVDMLRLEKLEERGGFKEGIVLKLIK